MADDAYELAVRIRPEGADEAQKDLDDVGETFSETADDASKSAEELSDFSRKWKGAAGIMVTSIGVMAGGLLSKVPIIQELFDGVGSVIDGLTYSIDEELRPVLEPLVDLLYDAGEGAANLDGDMRKLATGATLAGTGLAGAGAISLATGVSLTAILGPAALVAGAATAIYLAWDTDFAGIQGITETTLSKVDRLLSEHAPDIKQSWAELTASLKGEWDVFGIDVEGAYRWLFQALRDVGIWGIDLLLTATSAGLNVLTGDWEGAWEDVKGFGERTWDAIVGSYDAYRHQLVMLTGGLAVKVLTTFGDMWDKTRNAAAKGMNFIIDTIERGVNSVIKSLNKLPGVDMGTVSIKGVKEFTDGELRARAEARSEKYLDRLAALERRSSGRRSLDLTSSDSGTRSPWALESRVKVELDPRADKLLSASQKSGYEKLVGSF